MTPPTDALIAASDAMPSLMGAGLRVGLALALLAGGAWALVRWQRNSGRSKRSLQVLDRTMLARGASVALVKVEGRRLLLGVSGEGVRLIRDLDHAHGIPASAGFERMLADASARREALK